MIPRNYYLTVMGIAVFLPVSRSCSPAPLRISTYLFFNFSAASGDRRGPHLLNIIAKNSYFVLTFQNNVDGIILVRICKKYDIPSDITDKLLESVQINFPWSMLFRDLHSIHMQVHHVLS